MRPLLAITKALGDPSRIRILLMLRRRELCVCQITEVLGLAPSTVSRHLALLEQAGLIDCHKEGRWVHCRLPASETARPMVSEALDWVRRSARGDEQVRSDGRRLREILRMQPEALCNRQRMKAPARPRRRSRAVR